MGLLNTLQNFIQNPDNHWIIYTIAIFFIIDWLILRSIGRRLSIKGDNSGIAVNGNVKGNISQNQPSPITPVGNNDNPSPASRLISIMANISGIAGLIIAAVTFYLTYMK